jgi:hypothetical protein
MVTRMFYEKFQCSEVSGPTATKAPAFQRLTIEKHKPASAFSGVLHREIFSEDYSMC